jgi:predicted MFS family arabinose efflux permease
VRLPILALIGFFCAGFVAILTEALPAGLLPQMSRTLHETASVTGQTVTVYAVGTVISVVPLAVATSAWPRRHLLLLALTGLLVTNALTAASSSFVITLVIRFVAGLSSGLIWSLLGAYAARLAPPAQQGRAIAIALGGIPTALAFGIPFGTFLGSIATWQTAFLVSALLAILTIAWVRVTVPNLAGQRLSDRPRALSVLRLPGVRTILGVVAAFVVAHNILYTYIAAFLSHAGMGSQTKWVLFAFGFAAIVSILFVGSQIDARLRQLIIAATVLFSLSSLLLVCFPTTPELVYAAAVAWGLAFGSSATLFTAAVVNASGPAGDVGQSLMITVFSSGIALGGVIGGALLGGLGASSLAVACLILAVFSMAVTIGARQHAFPARRQGPGVDSL